MNVNCNQQNYSFLMQMKLTRRETRVCVPTNTEINLNLLAENGKEYGV